MENSILKTENVAGHVNPEDQIHLTIKQFEWTLHCDRLRFQKKFGKLHEGLQMMIFDLVKSYNETVKGNPEPPMKELLKIERILDLIDTYLILPYSSAKIIEYVSYLYLKDGGYYGK